MSTARGRVAGYSWETRRPASGSENCTVHDASGKPYEKYHYNSGIQLSQLDERDGRRKRCPPATITGSSSTRTSNDTISENNASNNSLNGIYTEYSNGITITRNPCRRQPERHPTIRGKQLDARLGQRRFLETSRPGSTCGGPATTTSRATPFPRTRNRDSPSSILLTTRIEGNVASGNGCGIFLACLNGSNSVFDNTVRSNSEGHPPPELLRQSAVPQPPHLEHRPGIQRLPRRDSWNLSAPSAATTGATCPGPTADNDGFRRRPLQHLRVRPSEGPPPPRLAGTCPRPPP